METATASGDHAPISDPPLSGSGNKPAGPKEIKLSGVSPDNPSEEQEVCRAEGSLEGTRDEQDCDPRSKLESTAGGHDASSDAQIEEQEIQFRCKLCQYTGKNKDEIASHFLSEHIAVEVRTIGKGESGNEGGFVEIARIEKCGSRKRGRPRGSCNRKKKSKATEEKDEDDDDGDDDNDGIDKVIVHNPSQVSISSRGRKRKVPFKFAVSADDDGSYSYPRSRRSKKAKLGKYWRLLREDESFFQRHLLKVTPTEFEAQLKDLVVDWEQTWFLMKSNEDVRCTHPGCKCQLDTEEMNLHTKCHRPYLEGFQCPMCDFVCVHWRNMRHHYYKEHQEKGKTLNCNQPDCHAAFDRFGELKRHVSSTHLKQRLLDRLNKRNGEGKGKRKDCSSSSEGVDEADRDGPSCSTSFKKRGGGDGSKGQVSVNSENSEVKEQGTVTVNLETKEGEQIKETLPGDDIVVTYSAPGQCEIEMTKKRITKRRKDGTECSKTEQLVISEPKKKRNYIKSKEFNGNLAERQRALVAFVCDLCGAKYNSVDDLEKHRGLHQVLEEDGSTLIKCTECDKKFSSSEPLVEHLKQKHVRLLKLHRCHLCQFASERRFDLKKHLFIHTGVKNHMCDQCGKCMSTPYNLKIHYLRLHARDDEKDINCTQDGCDFKCADKAVLKDHLRQKHNLMLDHKDGGGGKLEKIKIYSCKHCDYTGKKESSLRYHMRIHLENRQHKCQLCPYASKTKNNLILHMRTHVGMQPVECPQCKFRGATNKIISEHILTKHHGIKPYRCLVCKWSTSYSGNMWKHIHDHRNELGDKMPEEPVEIVTSNVSIPAPLRPPSGRKRKAASRRSPESPGVAQLKSPGTPSSPAQTIGLEALSQLIQINNASAGANPEETVTILEVPMNIGDGNMVMNSLAAAVATAREVALISQQAQAAMTGQQTTDTSNPYPVTNLFQQMAGQASASTAQSLAAVEGRKVHGAITSKNSFQHSVVQSGLTSSQITRTGQAEVTYTSSQQGVEYTVQSDALGNQSAASHIPVQTDQQVSDDGIFVNIDGSDLQIVEEGPSLQILENQTMKEQPQISDGNVQQLVTMTSDGQLVMNMVQGNPQTTQINAQQPVQTHIVVANPDNLAPYIQQEIHLVQAANQSRGQILEDASSQVVHILQHENGELVYQDSAGQVYSAQDSQVMYHQPGQTTEEFLPNEVPEAIAISDTRLGDVELAAGSVGQIVDLSCEGSQSEVVGGCEETAVGHSENTPDVFIPQTEISEQTPGSHITEASAIVGIPHEGDSDDGNLVITDDTQVDGNEKSLLGTKNVDPFVPNTGIAEGTQENQENSVVVDKEQETDTGNDSLQVDEQVT